MKRTVFAIALSAAALSANAADLDYNYVQGAYSKIDVENASLDGFKIDGSFKFNDSFYGIAGYQKNDQNGLSLDEYSLGAGFRKRLNARTDWVNELSYVHGNANLGNSLLKFDGNGYRVATGLRSLVSDKLELNGKLNYTDAGDFGNGFGVGVGGVYRVNDSFGITAGYDYADRDGSELNGWNLGARFSF